MFEFSYCEAIHPHGAFQLWNVASCIAYILLAAWVWRQPQHSLNRWGPIAIALGSVTWHTTGHYAGLALDVLGILSWFLLYTLDLCRARAVAPWRSLGILLLAVVFSYLCAKALGGYLTMSSGAFVPYSAALLYFALHKPYPKRLRMHCLASGIAMSIAIVARMADLPTCPALGGTHWLWHTLAAVSIIGPIKIIDHYIKSRPSSGASEENPESAPQGSH